MTQAMDIAPPVLPATVGQWHGGAKGVMAVKPCVIWFTGLSGSGKSTTARAVQQRLAQLGSQAVLLDGDELRGGLCADLGFTDADREENSRRIAEVAKLIVQAGHSVLVSAISPFRAHRAKARQLFSPGEFMEIYMSASLALCEARDPKGLYKRARLGQVPSFTGLQSPYEPPHQPELSLDSAQLSVAEACDQVIRLVLSPRGQRQQLQAQAQAQPQAPAPAFI